MTVRDDKPKPKAAWQRETGKKSESLAATKPRRKYAAAEALAGAELAERKITTKPLRQTKIVRPPPPRAKSLGKWQLIVEKAVRALFMTASLKGDLGFRAELLPEVFADLTVDVSLFGKQIEVTFYTRDSNTRRLLEGYARELRAVLEDKRLRVKSVRVLAEPDPSAPPPVPLLGGE